MLKVPTDSEAFCKNVQSGLRRTGMLISEADSCVYPVANCLHPRPSWRHCAKQLQRNCRETIDLAVATVVQIGQDLVWQFLNREFARIRAHAIGYAAIINQSRVAQAQCAL